MAGNILDELESMIARFTQQKAAAAKTSADVSSKLDNAEDGTSPASTGAQAKAMQAAQNKTYPDNAADVGAKDNKPGESVGASTQNATAVSTSGQEGAQGGQLGMAGEVSDDPKNAPDIPKNNGFDAGSFKSAAAACMKIAEALDKMADDLLNPMERFLVASVRNNPDPQVKKAAMEMPDDQLAANAAESLMREIESGNISDEEAAQILQEAVASGAVSEEEVAEAAQAAQAAMAEAGGGAVPEGGKLPGGGAPEGGMPEEALMEAKMAAADIGPDDERYIQKLAQLYADDMRAGYAYGMQLAQKLAQEADMESGEKEEGEKEEGEKEEGEKEYGEKKEEGGKKKGAPAVPFAGKETPAEEAAEGHPAADSSAVLGGVSPTGDMQGMMPGNPTEATDMAAIGQELGLTPEQLAQLMSAPITPEAAASMGKVASALKQGNVPYRTRLRTVLLNKVAALHS